MANTHPPESIYNLIPREEVKPEKPARYVSKFREQVKQEEVQKKAANRTMGPAKVDVPSPERFLHKHSKKPVLPEKKPFTYTDKGKKPQIPSKTDKPLMGIHTNKNFINTNAIQTIMAVPKKPQPIYADTRNGDKQVLELSGLVPKYVRKKDYGQTPEYLLQRTKEVRRAQEEYESYVKEHLRERAMKQLSEEERQEVVRSLKKNWEELHHQYQGLSVIIDTVPKKHRKERLEYEMRQLERDIELMEKNKTIFIANN